MGKLGGGEDSLTLRKGTLPEMACTVLSVSLAPTFGPESKRGKIGLFSVTSWHFGPDGIFFSMFV